jgi:hypothetical protein
MSNEEEKLDERLLCSFMETFFGYGNLRGDYWFIGVEEGGGATVEEIAERLRIWNSHGANTTEDLNAFCQELGANFPQIAKFFPPKSSLQNTWGALIRVLIMVRGGTVESASNGKALSRFQVTDFCRQNSDHCNLNLLPLPCPSTKKQDWKYDDWSSLPDLKERTAYAESWESRRVEMLCNLIAHHAPKLVVFYGNSSDADRRKLEQICATPLTAFCESPYLFGAKMRETTFVSMPHPARRDMMGGMFTHFGSWIRQFAEESQSVGQ